MFFFYTSFCYCSQLHFVFWFSIASIGKGSLNGVRHYYDQGHYSGVSRDTPEYLAFHIYNISRHTVLFKISSIHFSRRLKIFFLKTFFLNIFPKLVSLGPANRVGNPANSSRFFLQDFFSKMRFFL